MGNAIIHDETGEPMVDGEVHSRRRQDRRIMTTYSRGVGGGSGGGGGGGNGTTSSRSSRELHERTEEVGDSNRRQLKRPTRSKGELGESSGQEPNQQPTADEGMMPRRESSNTYRAQVLVGESSAPATGVAAGEFGARLVSGELLGGREAAQVLPLGASLEGGRTSNSRNQQEGPTEKESFHPRVAIRKTEASGDDGTSPGNVGMFKRNRGLGREDTAPTPPPEVRQDADSVETTENGETGRVREPVGAAGFKACFAWIPEDPCATVGTAGVIGEASRYWVWAARGGVWGPRGPITGSRDEVRAGVGLFGVLSTVV